jgi:hypothetical protein
VDCHDQGQAMNTLICEFTYDGETLRLVKVKP